MDEEFRASTPVAGTMVAGALLGPLVAVSDPATILIPNPEPNTALCFVARTRDGQYWAQSSFSTPQQSEFLTLERHGGWQHKEELSQYDGGDFAVSVRAGQDCAINPDAPLLPVSYSPDPASSTLHVAINSQRAIALSASLRLDENTVEGRCNRAGAPGERSTAFQYWCSFSLPDSQFQQIATLIVERRLRTGPRVDEVTLIITH
ncbi:MAG: hypothetical protein ACE360_04015 [Hyphomicrobiales bacterium]